MIIITDVACNVSTNLTQYFFIFPIPQKWNFNDANFFISFTFPRTDVACNVSTNLGQIGGNRQMQYLGNRKGCPYEIRLQSIFLLPLWDDKYFFNAWFSLARTNTHTLKKCQTYLNYSSFVDNMLFIFWCFYSCLIQINIDNVTMI